jgi:hypothetical protein
VPDGAGLRFPAGPAEADPRRIVSKEQTTDTAEDRASRAEAALEEALSERNRLWAELNQERADQRELEYLRRELKTIHSSTWWTVVGAYKRIKALVRTGLARLRER